MHGLLLVNGNVYVYTVNIFPRYTCSCNKLGTTCVCVCLFVYIRRVGHIKAEGASQLTLMATWERCELVSTAKYM